MAGIAIIRRQYMIGRFANRISAVMTADTIVNKVGMVGYAAWRKPTIGVMTYIAFIGRDDMIRPLAASQGSIMTAGTHANGLAVIHRAGR